MEDVFERGKIGWEGNFSFENFKKGCNDIFLLLELLPNMPDIQSLKVLLLFAKQQGRILMPLHDRQSCVIIPLAIHPLTRSLPDTQKWVSHDPTDRQTHTQSHRRTWQCYD